MILYLLACAAVGTAVIFLIGAAGTKLIMHFEYAEPLAEADVQDWIAGLGLGLFLSSCLFLVTILGAAVIGLSCGSEL